MGLESAPNRRHKKSDQRDFEVCLREIPPREQNRGAIAFGAGVGHAVGETEFRLIASALAELLERRDSHCADLVGDGNDGYAGFVKKCVVLLFRETRRDVELGRENHAGLQPDQGRREPLFRARDGALVEALLGRSGMPLHLAGHLRAEEWNGAVNPGFIISDAAPA